MRVNIFTGKEEKGQEKKQEQYIITKLVRERNGRHEEVSFYIVAICNTWAEYSKRLKEETKKADKNTIFGAVRLVDGKQRGIMGTELEEALIGSIEAKVIDTYLCNDLEI